MRLLLLFLCCTPLFYFGAEQIPVISTTDHDFIYIEGNAILYGEVQQSSDGVANLTSSSSSSKPQTNSKKEKISKITTQVKDHHNSRDQRIQKIQDQVNSRIHFNYFLADKSHSSLINSSDSYSGEMALTAYSFKFLGDFTSTIELARFLPLYIQKRKLFISLSYLQFGNFRSSSLRAPPTCFL